MVGVDAVLRLLGEHVGDGASHVAVVRAVVHHPGSAWTFVHAGPEQFLVRAGCAVRYRSTVSGTCEPQTYVAGAVVDG